ncbi:MAG: hypothetical protein RR324_08500 [Cellulosilyticaceae bacterium]
MYSEINKELEKQKEKMYEYQKLERMYEKYKEELNQLEKKAYELRRQLEKENLDIEKMSKIGIKTLFYTVLGSQEKQVEKERQEALEVKLKFDQCEEDIEDVKQQMKALSVKKRECSGAERRYEQLYQEKRDRLINSNTASAEKIMELTNQIANEKANLKEIKEAILAGSRVVSCLDQVLKSLGSAENWGVWDMFGGGGLVTDMIKHSHIDEAKNLAGEAQALLRRFKTELADVHIGADIHIETDGFAKFADFFFDGLIADWFMQSKINTSQESVESVKYQVDSVVIKLQQMVGESERAIGSLENDLSVLIATA